jgi:multidrug efflux system outer membrane protein
MFKRRISTLAIFPLILGGCAVGPDFEEPRIASPETWRAGLPDDSPSAANLPWWEFFQDEDLRRLVRVGLEQNKDIRTALARMEQARAALGVSDSAFLPAVGYNGSAYHSDPKVTLSYPHGYALGGSVQWEIDLWGRVRRLHESAQAQYFASVESKNAVVLALVSEIAAGYFNLRMLDEQAAIADQTAKTREAAWKLAKDRLDKEVGNAIDALQFEADMIAAQTSVIGIKNAISLQENALSVLLGGVPGAVARKPAAEAAPAPLPPIPAGLPASLLLNRPDLRAAVQNVRAANAQIGAAVANYFPKISLTGMLGFVHPQLGHLLESGSKGAQAGGNFLGPIFDGGATYFSVKAAEARTREAVLNYEQTALNAFREVNDALSTLQATRERAALLRREVAVLADALEKTRRAYEAGKVALLPVLDADRNLFSVKLTLAEAQAAEQTTAVRLYKALGGGWRSKDLDKPLVDSRGQITDGPGQSAAQPQNDGK